MYILRNIKEIISELPLRRKIILFLSVLLIIAIIIALIVSKNVHKKHETTGEVWFDTHSYFMQDMISYTDQLDTVVSLYYNGNLSEEAYCQQMDVLQKEMALFIKNYTEIKDSVEIKIGSHTNYSKLGSDSAERAYYMVYDLVNNCMKPEYYQDKEKLIYMYIAQGDAIEKELYTYASCLTAEKKKEFDKLVEEGVIEINTDTDAEINTNTDAEEGE